ncbi:hypothetical protein AZG88_38555 [Rhodococcus sp. LB1]|nr:hypothetical protein AZG88_38555 [Rhodococcus sp. LB1]
MMLCKTSRVVASISALMSISVWLMLGGAHRVQTGVRLVDEDDLRIEHQSAGRPGSLRGAAGDLPGRLVLRPQRSDEFHRDLADVGYLLLLAST